MRLSEEQELEKVMLEDKMKMTDWEATNEAIEEQIARESYVQWLRDNERRVSKNKKIKFTATATVTTTTISSSSTTTTGSNNGPTTSDDIKSSPKQSSPRLSPKAGSSGMSHSTSLCDPYGIVETSSFVNQFPPQMFGMIVLRHNFFFTFIHFDFFCSKTQGINDWDNEDGDILRQVLAQSQQEYLDSLKRNAKETAPSIEKASTSRATFSVSTNESSTKTRCRDESFSDCEHSSKRMRPSDCSPSRSAIITESTVDSNEINGSLKSDEELPSLTSKLPTSALPGNSSDTKDGLDHTSDVAEATSN